MQSNQKIVKMNTKSPKNIVGHVVKIKVRLRRIKNKKTERNLEKNIEDTVLAVNRLLKKYRNTKRIKESVEVSKVIQVGLFLQVTLIVDGCIFRKKT